MFIHVAVIAFLFLARLRFPKAVAEVIRSTYSKYTVKIIRKLEKLDYHLRKAELDLQFLSKCDNSNIPNFLDFHFANSHLEHSSTYRLCQLNLLREKIFQKKCTVRTLQK